jgi:hypothetical protein
MPRISCEGRGGSGSSRYGGQPGSFSQRVSLWRVNDVRSDVADRGSAPLDAFRRKASGRSRPPNARPLPKISFRRNARSASTHIRARRGEARRRSPPWHLILIDTSAKSPTLKLDRSNVTVDSTRFVLALFTPPIVKIPAYKVPLTAIPDFQDRFLIFRIARERKAIECVASI